MCVFRKIIQNSGKYVCMGNGYIDRYCVGQGRNPGEKDFYFYTSQLSSCDQKNIKHSAS